MNKRVLVTGGAGFLGVHQCESLLNEGYDVLCVDNLSSGYRDNITHLLVHPRFEFLRHDITFPLYVEVDEIFNYACPASPVFYKRDPVQTTKTCVHGAINMLGLAKRLKIKILQASTSEVYGVPEVSPLHESYWGRVNPIGFRACYNEGKRCAETLFMNYYRQHGIPIKVARIFNTYGPRMRPDDGRVMSNFIIQALMGKSLTVYGNGRQTRSFCYVDDMIEGLTTLMRAEAEITGPINLGKEEEITIIELAETIIEMTNSRSAIEYHEISEDDPTIRRPDAMAARTLLNWEAKTPLREGLQKTIAYFEGILSCGCPPY